MSTPKLVAKGAFAKAPAKLPALQALRGGDPEVRKAVEAIREWVEVRLGSRGDPFETAVTLRELTQELAPLQTTLDKLKAASAVEVVAALPPLAQGEWAQVGDDLYYCNGKAWKLVTLT